MKPPNPLPQHPNSMDEDEPIDFEMSAGEAEKRRATYLCLADKSLGAPYAVALLDSEHMVMAWVGMEPDDLRDFAESILRALDEN